MIPPSLFYLIYHFYFAERIYVHGIFITLTHSCGDGSGSLLTQVPSSPSNHCWGWGGVNYMLFPNTADSQNPISELLKSRAFQRLRKEIHLMLEVDFATPNPNPIRDEEEPNINVSSSF